MRKWGVAPFPLPLIMRRVPLALVLAASAPLLAQPGPAAGARASVARTTQSPLVDGRDTDAAWASAPRFDDFRQFAPAEDGIPTFRTEVRALSDDGQIALALHVVDLLALGAGSDPATVEARRLKAELCRQAAASNASYVTQSLYLNGADVLERANAETAS